MKYDTQMIAFRIKNELRTKNLKTKELLSAAELGINTISEFSKGKQISCISLAKIADYLECSVDYLLGRSDNVAMSSASNPDISNRDSELLELFKNLPPETSELITQLLKSVIDKPDTVKNLKEMIQKVS